MRNARRTAKRPSLVSYRYEPIAVAACILRRFALSGEALKNPITGFNREVNASKEDEDGPLSPTTYLGEITSEQFYRERGACEAIGKAVWDSGKRLSAKEVLLKLLKLEGLLNPDCEKYDWSEYEYIEAFAESECYMHDYMVMMHNEEKENIMACIDNSDAMTHSDCVRMFGRMLTVPNPAAALRRLDNEGKQWFASEGERVRDMSEIDALSRRIWNFRAHTDMGQIIANLLLQADGGKADLALIDKYADLIGARHLPGGVSASEASREEDLEFSEIENYSARLAEINAARQYHMFQQALREHAASGQES